MVFLANLLLPALPFDMGRIVRATVARPVFGESRDAMIAPWLAHVSAILLALIGGLRLVLYRRADSLTLIFLALLIEVFVRAEARMMEEGSFFDDGVFGYDFSEGYTSLEASTAKVRPHREPPCNAGETTACPSAQRSGCAAQFAADDRADSTRSSISCIVQGKASLTEEENRFLVRVSAKIKKRPKERE